MSRPTDSRQSPLSFEAQESLGETSDSALADAAAGGDRGAFERLGYRYWDRIRGFCSVISGFDENIADEASQDALVRLHSALPKWRKTGSLSAFIYGLCRHAVADAARRRARHLRRTVSLDETESLPSDNVRATPDHSLLQNELESALAEAMRSLDPDDRALLYLHEAEAASIRELSQGFGIPEGTVKSRLHRARGKLADLMREKGYG